MEIKEIFIDNYKSLVDFKLEKPNSFTVFVGANASGKSNIFEALELCYFFSFMNTNEALKLFGSAEDLFNKTRIGKFNSAGGDEKMVFRIFLWNENDGPNALIEAKKEGDKEYSLGPFWPSDKQNFSMGELEKIKSLDEEVYKQAIKDYSQFFNFTRLFVTTKQRPKLDTQGDSKLLIDGSNLKKVLKRLLKDENKKEEIVEWLHLLIPGFEKIEIVSEPLSGSDNLLIYEKGTNKPFTENLISDGTKNILSILAAVYQSDEPQFLCIEEPENGLNPKVIKELVNLFRQKCDEGHFIWLNTHSQTLVSELTTEEIIIIDKKDGITIPKQIKGMNLHGLKMDEALLTNALGGGIPW